MFWRVVEAFLVLVYLFGVGEITRRTPAEIDKMVKDGDMPRVLCELMWTGLIVFWPIAVPLGWLMIASGAKR
jgi:hypothetical protein